MKRYFDHQYLFWDNLRTGCEMRREMEEEGVGGGGGGGMLEAVFLWV